ncbi:Fic family protein [Blastococcus jejuensis]|uniref:Fic family protein n=1 Tax=Blastococcus jejuensis TaxID=351224 RepID=A0ABP6PLP8_9ACTN
MAAPELAEYEPFPSFEEFTEVDFDDTTFSQFADILEQARAAATKEQMAAAVEKATKWAAIDTGAIEGLYEVDRGFTFTVAAEAAAWDNVHLQKGESVERAIQDALNGYEFVLDVATQSRPITETWIKELHTVICASQDTHAVITAAGKQDHPLPKGSYKAFPNNPLNLAANQIHGYAPVSDTPAEMHRLIQELNSEAFATAHPVVQAAYAHYAFVCVHPFADGNGRVSRALASVYLYRSPGVPLVIFADQKPAYLDALEAADRGAYRPFIHFIADRAVDVVRMVSADMRRQPRPSVSDRMQEMRRALLGRGGLPHEEVDALASLLFDEFVAALDRAMVSNPVEHPLSIRKGFASGSVARLEPYRNPPNSRILQLEAKSAPPASAKITLAFSCMIMKGQADGPDFVIVGGSPVAVVEEALIRDLQPTVSPALTYRLDVMAEDIVLGLVDRTVAAGAETLRKTGYSD